MWIVLICVSAVGLHVWRLASRVVVHLEQLLCNFSWLPPVRWNASIPLPAEGLGGAPIPRQQVLLLKNGGPPLVSSTVAVFEGAPLVYSLE